MSALVFVSFCVCVVCGVGAVLNTLFLKFISDVDKISEFI